MDEAHMKAKETRERNKAARKAAREAREAEEKLDKALVVEAMRAVLRDPEATTAQRIYGVAVLEEVQRYHFVPCSVKYPGYDTTPADIKEKLEALQAEDT